MSFSGEVTTRLSLDALQRIVREAVVAPGRETGGVLVGSFCNGAEGKLEIHAERASGPGEQALLGSGVFRPEMPHYRDRVAYYRRTKNWNYLGEWHKHPGSFGALSRLDVLTAREICETEGWPFLFLPVITLCGDDYRIDCHVWMREDGGDGGEGGEGEIRHTGVYEGSVSDILREREGAYRMKLYIDQKLIQDFRASSASEAEHPGVWNKGESFVFIPGPGVKNARLRLVREGCEATVNLLPGGVLGVVGEDSERFWMFCEGEMVSVVPEVIDMGAAVYERNAGLLETMELAGKCVCLVGCGSLGGTIALELARAGVGRFFLFDMDTLEPANLSRHVAGVDELGRNKAYVVERRIRSVNPNIQVSCCTRNVVDDPGGMAALEEAAKQSHLLICTTDTDDSRVLVNSISVEHGIKSLQVGLHERAASGIVQLVRPGEACFSCHRRRILSESALRSEKVSYSEAEDPRDLYVQPGLSAQINLVAEVGALRAIEALMDRDSHENLTLVYVDRGGEAPEVESGEARGRELQLRICRLELEKVSGCPVCGGE
ncbi:hypothetical protein FF3_00917 [Fretibacterium fastidiosum]|uniref:ThiF family adenylyltransferase n=2 Tax=Fretibacterium fastidiosum TaxID=651822 RepID=UPI0038FD2CC8